MFVYMFLCFCLMCDLSVVSVFFCSVLMFFTKNVSHSPTQAFEASESAPGNLAWLLQLVQTHGLHWKSGTKVLHICMSICICMCMTFVFFCLHMRFLLSIV
jgi:hypothetical protein